MKVSKLALVCLVMLAVLAGCKSSRKATGEGGAEAKEGRALLEAVEEGALEFHTLSARLSADLKLQDGKELGSRVELKMVRDSMIQLSVQPFLGIEVFRLELTTDTVRLIDRMGKRYVAERYSGLLEQSPVDFNFYNLQALFINRIFLPGQADFTKKEYNRFRMSRAPEYTEFKATDRGKLFYTFRIDREEKLARTEINDAEGRFSLAWRYADFQTYGQQLFPVSMNADVVVDNRNVGGLSLYYSRIQLDKTLKFSNEQLRKYRRVTLEEILKSL